MSYVHRSVESERDQMLKPRVGEKRSHRTELRERIAFSACFWESRVSRGSGSLSAVG
jgi:hypothetical protein